MGHVHIKKFAGSPHALCGRLFEYNGRPSDYLLSTSTVRWYFGITHKSICKTCAKKGMK